MNHNRRALFALLVWSWALSSFAQSPGWSRGQQLLSIGFEDCVSRTAQALRAEAYSVEYAAGAFAVGRKGVHTGVITCNASADGRQWINVVVASNGEGGASERQRLQGRMEGAAIPPPPPPPPPRDDSAATIHFETRGYSIFSDSSCQAGRRMKVRCDMANQYGGKQRVWGTDVYSLSSSICRAAIHAGVPGVAEGAAFTVGAAPGQAVYNASVRNGVQSEEEKPYRPNQTCSFRFVTAAPVLIYPPPPRREGVTGFLGCFKDTSVLDLDGYVVRLDDNTPDRCVAICREKGFPFAAVQYGQSCLCGRSYGRYGSADNCNMRCSGNPNQACGGYSANSVYRTGLPQ